MKTFENEKYLIEIVETELNQPFAIWIEDKETKRAIRIDLEKPVILLFGERWRVV